MYQLYYFDFTCFPFVTKVTEILQVEHFINQQFYCITFTLPQLQANQKVIVAIAPFPPREYTSMSTRNHLAPQCPTNFIGLINEHKMIDPDCAEFFWEVSEDSTVGENSLIFRMKGGVREPPDPYCAGMIVHVLIPKWTMKSCHQLPKPYLFKVAIIRHQCVQESLKPLPFIVAMIHHQSQIESPNIKVQMILHLSQIE